MSPPPVDESKYIAYRRKRAEVAAQLPLAGLALSGGGIRSATFNLGLLRGLAQQGQLRRFDYLSTVSGGGYIGAAFGRLFGKPGTSARKVEKRLASDDTLFLWWLRNNGRYLIPAGARDRLVAFSSMLRGFVATQVEVGVLMLCIALLDVLPHLAIIVLKPNPLTTVGLERVPTGWFLLALLPFFGCLALSWSYWFSRDRTSGVRPGSDAFFALVMLLLAIGAGISASHSSLSDGATALLLPYVVVVLVSAAVPCGWLFRLPWSHSLPAQQRLLHTQLLGVAVAWMLGFFALGLLDMFSWYLVVTLRNWLDAGAALWASTGLFGSTGLLVLVVRSLLPTVLEHFKDTQHPSVALDKIANVFGILCLVALLLLWSSALHIFIFLCDGLLDYAWGPPPLWHAAIVIVFLGLYVWVSGNDLQQLNLASLHQFYRSRLARTYVSSGNSGKGKNSRYSGSPLDSATPDSVKTLDSIKTLLKDDDIYIRAYKPHRSGGPIHLINCCINQTIDDRTGNYNADRKGVALTISALGVETGTRPPEAFIHNAFKHTTLAQWIEISGAAISTGMGSMTSTGLAALLFLSGLRLGYWVDNLISPKVSRQWLTKYRASQSELLASFPGLQAPYWYVSDGGQFDNTGVYALLKRKLPLIVLSDCGADPQYLFEDLENLIRKAKIDYGAHIAFIDPQSLKNVTPPASTLWQLFGTPATITPGPGDACLLLARIVYHDKSIGSLLVVKPRVTASSLIKMPFDMIGYADAHPAFPQQSTGDQFFDEAQWESYHGLGLILGRLLDRDLLDSLPEWVRDGRTVSMPSALASTDPQPDKPDASAPKTPTRRDRIAALKTSVGIGISASLIIALWQGLEQRNDGSLSVRKDYDATFQKIDEALPKLESTLTVKRWINQLQKLSESMNDQDLFSNDIAYFQDRLNELCKSNPAGKTCDLASSLVRPEPKNLPYQYWFGFTPPRASARHVSGSDLSSTSKRYPLENRWLALSYLPSADKEATEIFQAKSPCAVSGDEGLTLYTQIYGETERSDAVNFLQNLVKLGVRPEGVENVTLSAARHNRPAPVPWPQPTFIYHNDSDKPCADFLAKQYEAKNLKPARSVALSASLKKSPGVIEFWLPPAL